MALLPASPKARGLEQKTSAGLAHGVLEGLQPVFDSKFVPQRN